MNFSVGSVLHAPGAIVDSIGKLFRADAPKVAQTPPLSAVDGPLQLKAADDAPPPTNYRQEEMKKTLAAARRDFFISCTGSLLLLGGTIALMVFSLPAGVALSGPVSYLIGTWLRNTWLAWSSASNALEAASLQPPLSRPVIA